MTTYYEVVVQLLRKTREESCSIVVMSLVEKKKRFGLTFSLLPRQKKPNKIVEYNCICLSIYLLIYFWTIVSLMQLFIFLFICIYYIFIYLLIYVPIYLSVYLCIYLLRCLCIFVILVQGGGRFWAKGNKEASGEALPIVHCTERTFSTFVLCTNISKLQYKKSKSQ